MKKLKQFAYYSNYGSDKGTQYYIMASSQKEVVGMLGSIGNRTTLSYVRDFFYKAWGNDGNELLKDVEITGPCVYSVKRNNRFGSFTSEPEKVVG
jgi:hypothetical protein